MVAAVEPLEHAVVRARLAAAGGHRHPRALARRPADRRVDGPGVVLELDRSPARGSVRSTVRASSWRDQHSSARRRPRRRRAVPTSPCRGGARCPGGRRRARAAPPGREAGQQPVHEGRGCGRRRPGARRGRPACRPRSTSSSACTTSNVDAGVGRQRSRRRARERRPRACRPPRHVRLRVFTGAPPMRTAPGVDERGHLGARSAR